MKAFSKCDMVKLRNEFYDEARTPDGKMHHCKTCRSICSAEYREKNKEKIAFTSKKYRSNNKEKVKKRKDKYRENNKEKITVSRANRIASLPDSYLIEVINQGKKTFEIPKELIELKRIQLLIKRELRK